MWVDFRGTRTATNLARELQVPPALVRRHLKPKAELVNPYNQTMTGYYSVEAAREFFASEAGQEALAEHQAGGRKARGVDAELFESCLVRWSTTRRDRAPDYHEASGATVRICGGIATITLTDGRKVRKTTGSLGFQVIPLQEGKEAA
jgi:hypothetical protein